METINVGVLRAVGRVLRHKSLPSLLVSALFGRFLVTTFQTWNLQWDLEESLTESRVHIELVDVLIVALGFLIVGVHILAIADTVFCLKNCLTQKQSCQKLFSKQIWCKVRSFLVVLATTCCSANAVAMFFFVREKWVRHLCPVIQLLHLCPFIAVICQTLSNGLLSYVTPLLDIGVRPFARVDHERAAWTHVRSNSMLFVYAVLNLVVIVTCQEQLMYLLFIVTSLIGRGILTYNMLGQKTVHPRIEPPNSSWYYISHVDQYGPR